MSRRRQRRQRRRLRTAARRGACSPPENPARRGETLNWATLGGLLLPELGDEAIEQLRDAQQLWLGQPNRNGNVFNNGVGIRGGQATAVSALQAEIDAAFIARQEVTDGAQHGHWADAAAYAVHALHSLLPNDNPQEFQQQHLQEPLPAEPPGESRPNLQRRSGQPYHTQQHPWARYYDLGNWGPGEAPTKHDSLHPGIREEIEYLIEQDELQGEQWAIDTGYGTIWAQTMTIRADGLTPIARRLNRRLQLYDVLLPHWTHSELRPFRRLLQRPWIFRGKGTMSDASIEYVLSCEGVSASERFVYVDQLTAVLL